ncbi:MAG: glycosyltransferase [Chloroflexi bacterium]|nr:glycosyltransferase [Chloroflexota bacterium]
MSFALPLVSIITPVFNGAKYIGQLIESVVQQEYSRIEHIVIDDGSDDDGATVAVLEQYPHLRWWSRENRGQYPTMNEGLDAAKGELICFISADDLMASGAVKSVVDEFLEHPEYSGIYGKILWMNDDGSLRHAQELIASAPLWLFKYRTFISHCSLYMKKDILEQHELYFDTSLHFVGDFDWIIRIAELPLRIGYVDQNLSLVRYHSSQASQVHAQAIREESHLIYQRYGVNRILRKIILTSIHWATVIKSLWGALLSGGLKEVNLMVAERLTRD